MQKRFSILAVVFMLCKVALAQAQEAPAPVIQALRALVESGKTNFRSDVGALVEVDTPSRVALYKTVRESAGATTGVLQSLDGGRRVYMIRYEVKDLSTDMLVLMNRFVNLYIDELNAMVKSGAYTGKDGTDANGLAVTEIWDTKGNHILDYKSNQDLQAIYLYGLNADSK